MIEHIGMDNQQPQQGEPAVTRASRDLNELIPPECEVIEVHVADLQQLFNSIDPAPFREKDLDPNAEEFIVSWARDVDRNARLALLVHVDQPAGIPEETSILRDAIRKYFGSQALATRKRLRRLFRQGRLSLLIGFCFLALSIGAGGLLEGALAGRRIGEILRESLLIGGWVAMWRPLEIFLYEWWPILADARLFNRLSGMPVRIVGGAGEFR
jgi:hypothetical protein